MSAPERAGGDRALLRFLARQGRLTNDDVTRVEALLEEQGATVHDVLERENLIGQKDLALLLAETLRLRLVDLTTYPLDANVTRELKENIATRYEVVPISIDEHTIEVVTANPLDLDGLKAVEFATGKRVQAVVATYLEVKDALAHTYRLQESLEQFLQLVPVGESLVVNELSDDGGDLRSIAADAELPPVIKLADKMLIEGIKSRASDIHVEPETDSVLVRYRVDGILEEAFRFPKWIQNPLVARLKVMAKLDITERRLPQDGRIQVRYSDKSVDMRVSSLPAQHGEKITLRILDASQAVKALDRLGFSPGDLKILRDAAKKPQGMILITGPTGSGKTTTLYALLREIFSPKTNIVTIENPIEYQLKGINQVEVNEKQGLTFGGVLRSVLRQDPDVILLGEIRDKETAQIAFQAASTGHLVLSTVHTNDAAGAVTRLLDLGLESYAIASALNLVVAQRLVRQLCPTCSKPAELDDEVRRQLHLDDECATVKENVGCAQCRYLGYRSRLGVYEMLPMTTAMGKLVEAGAGESLVRQQARNEGLHTLLEDAVEKLRSGLTTVEELQRVVQIADDRSTQCPSCRKEVADDYSVCPHCSKTLRATCGGCAKPLSPEWVSCPYCGAGAVDIAGLSAEAPAAAAERRSFKALVVDDTSTIRDVVRHTLEHSDLGLTVLTAENGLVALELAGREHPDIVVLDISMPGMDGFEVCRRLRSEMRTAFVPVLMLTAHDSEDDVARGFGVGADDYMVKPFRREGLLARVRRILERTYGSRAIGGAALPEPAAPVVSSDPGEARPERFASAPPAGVDVGAALAELSADRDALRRGLESCELRIAELAARPLAVDGGTSEREPVAPPVLTELRGLVAEMHATQERGLRELREETARALAMAEEALKAVPATAPTVPAAQFAAMMTTVERLQGEQASLASAVAAARGTGEDADAECERRLQMATQEIEESRAAIAALQAQRQQDAQRLAAAEAMAQEAQREIAAMTARCATELADIRHRADAHQGDHARDAERLESVAETARAVRSDLAAAVEQTGRELAEMHRRLATQEEARDQDGRRAEDAVAALERVRHEAMAAAENAARAAHDEAMAASRHAADEITDLRTVVAEQIAAVRAQTVAALAALRTEHASLTREVAERLADLPSAAEHRTVRAFLDGCETQLIEFATRLDAEAQERAASDGASRERLQSDLEGVKSTIERLDGAQRRLAADVEERLRGVMRTAAGGFDVQLALLRGKVEVLARTLRERLPVDPATVGDDAILQHRRGLMDLLRQQLAALQAGTDWRPQRVLDLLIESTLAAAVTPFRRILQLAENAPLADQPTAHADETTVTDESASPS